MQDCIGYFTLTGNTHRSQQIAYHNLQNLHHIHHLHNHHHHHHSLQPWHHSHHLAYVRRHDHHLCHLVICKHTQLQDKCNNARKLKICSIKVYCEWRLFHKENHEAASNSLFGPQLQDHGHGASMLGLFTSQFCWYQIIMITDSCNKVRQTCPKGFLHRSAVAGC